MRQIPFSKNNYRSCSFISAAARNKERIVLGSLSDRLHAAPEELITHGGTTRQRQLVWKCQRRGRGRIKLNDKQHMTTADLSYLREYKCLQRSADTSTWGPSGTPNQYSPQLPGRLHMVPPGQIDDGSLMSSIQDPYGWDVAQLAPRAFIFFYILLRCPCGPRN